VRDGLRIVDGDAHVIEPHRIWTDYLEPSFRDPAPKPVGLTFGFRFDRFSVNLPGQWSPKGASEEVARLSERIQATFAELFPDAYARSFSAEAQLADMDREGVDVAYLYPSFGLFVLASDDIETQLAGALARGYIDWLAEFCRADPTRLCGAALLPIQDPEAAAVEAVRCATSLGFRAAFVRPNPVSGRNFDDPAYDPLWDVLSSHSIALGIHEGGFPRLPQVVYGRLTHPEQLHICTHPMEQMIAAVSIIYGVSSSASRGCAWRSSRPAADGSPSGSTEWTSTGRTPRNETTGRPRCCRWRRVSTSGGNASCRPTPPSTCLRR
jgi:hypothetical protein